MPGALSYLIEKVEGLEKTAQSLLNRQEERSSPIHMDWIETIKCLSHEQIGAFIIAM